MTEIILSSLSTTCSPSSASSPIAHRLPYHPSLHYHPSPGHLEMVCWGKRTNSTMISVSSYIKLRPLHKCLKWGLLEKIWYSTAKYFLELYIKFDLLKNLTRATKLDIACKLCKNANLKFWVFSFFLKFKLLYPAYLWICCAEYNQKVRQYTKVSDNEPTSPSW